ncbi:MAG: hypothetical protein ACFNJN_09460 [Capnocytophaga ochracea]|jgi:hypothetical protein
MITKLSELKEGSLILCKKEEDNTFSSLLLSEEQGKALKAFLISLNEDEPLISLANYTRLIEKTHLYL